MAQSKQMRSKDWFSSSVRRSNLLHPPWDEKGSHCCTECWKITWMKQALKSNTSVLFSVFSSPYFSMHPRKFRVAPSVGKGCHLCCLDFLSREDACLLQIQWLCFFLGGAGIAAVLTASNTERHGSNGMWCSDLDYISPWGLSHSVCLCLEGD